MRRARRALAGARAGRGHHLVVHPARHGTRSFGGGQDALELANPISTEMSSMRPSLLPGLLAAVQRNRNRGFADVALFEVGQAYRGDAPEGPVHRRRPACARVLRRSRAPGAIGPAPPRRPACSTPRPMWSHCWRSSASTPRKAQLTRDAPAWFHPGRSATLRLGPKIVLAHFGELHPETLRTLDVAGPVAAFEVFLGALPPERRKGLARAPSRPPTCCPCVAISPSCSTADVPAGDVVKAALAADKKLIAGVSVFDLFEGESLGAGKKSLALEVTLQPRDKTLTDQEIEAVAARIVAAVGKATGGEIRRMIGAVSCLSRVAVQARLPTLSVIGLE